MRHDHQGAAGPLGEGPLRTLLGLRVQMARRLVEQDERGVRQIGAGQRHELPLARGERGRLDRRPRPAERFEQRQEPHRPGRGEQFGLGHGVGPQVPEILGEGAGVDVRLLRDEHPARGGRRPGHGVPAHPDRALSGLQQPGDQCGERGLPYAARAYDGEVGAGWQGEVEVLDDGGGGGAVGEGERGEGEGGGVGWAGGGEGESGGGFAGVG
ncbi:hypothetical protein TN53_04310, partial [Streptomyces sp. WM6386]